MKNSNKYMNCDWTNRFGGAGKCIACPKTVEFVSVISFSQETSNTKEKTSKHML